MIVEEMTDDNFNYHLSVIIYHDLSYLLFHLNFFIPISEKRTA